MVANPTVIGMRSSITCTGITDDLLDKLRSRLATDLQLDVLANAQRLGIEAQQGILQGDVVLLGPGVEQPIRLAQQVRAFDKTLPVIILSPPEGCADLRNSIMFAPLLGSEVTLWSLTDFDDLPQAISKAAERHQQRRHYLDTIESAQPKLGNLSLSQPEIGHYLGRLLDQAPIGVVSLDLQGCILDINRQAGRILKISEREVLGVPLSTFILESSHQRMTNLLMRSAVAQKFGTTPEVFESIPIGGQKRYLEATASPIAYRAGQRGFMVILQDVTPRERAEQLRRKTENHMRKLSSALEQAADSIMITDADRVVEYVNPAFEALTGFSKIEAIGQKTYFLRSGVQDQIYYDNLAKTISTGSVFRGVLVNRKKNGTKYHEEKTITPLRNHEGDISHYISTGHDITDRLEAEKAISDHQAQMAHVSRLSSLGEMTSGLAHELNQPLCAITTYAQTCMRVIATENYDREKLRYGLEQVIKQAELAGAIFKRLRNFSRKGDTPKRHADILEIIDEVASLVGAELFQSHVKLNIVHSGPVPKILVDPIQIEQVILNLLRNCMDSLADLEDARKTITLRVAQHSKTEIKLSITDHGTGCSDTVIERLFEPFFTTKETGLGIGLGISQSIIEAHGGKLFLESSTSAGTTFSFTLQAFEPANDSGNSN